MSFTAKGKKCKKSRQTNTSHFPTKTISKTNTHLLNANKGCLSPCWYYCSSPNCGFLKTSLFLPRFPTIQFIPRKTNKGRKSKNKMVPNCLASLIIRAFLTAGREGEGHLLNRRLERHWKNEKGRKMKNKMAPKWLSIMLIRIFLTQQEGEGG